MEIVIEKDVRVAMRDGCRLATDVYRPRDATDRPALVQRTPYDKENLYLRNWALDVLRAVQAGYVVVTQDTRGRYKSEGTFEPFVDDGPDGADTIAWAAAQPWCSGAVGMVGGSYFGATQWRAASEAPPALKAFAPVMTAADYYQGWVYQGGAFELGFCLLWTLIHIASGEVVRRRRAGVAAGDRLADVFAAIDAVDDLYRHRPMVDLALLDDLAPHYRDWLEHAIDDGYWQRVSPQAHHGQITAPALNIGGWYDIFNAGTLANYVGMRRHGATPGARRPRLLVGPWGHGLFSGWFTQREYGFRSNFAVVDPTSVQLRWFDHHLRGLDNGVADEPPVRIFVMGIDAWRDEEDWPLPDAVPTRYYLHSDGHAKTASGDGTLSTVPPEDEPSDAFLYDPNDPVPTIGGATILPGSFIGANAGPLDQRPLAGRQDILCFATAPLERDTEVTGPLRAVLHMSSSAPDTDITAKLVDVHPDGRAEILADGILRARYRDSFASPSLLEPDRVYALGVEIGATANVFLAGHRIRLDVSSSNFPRFDRNTNTGNPIAHDGPADVRVAVNRIFHDRHHPSFVELPLVVR